MAATRVLDAFAPDVVDAVRAIAEEVERESGVAPFGAGTWAGLTGNSVLGDRGVLVTDDTAMPVAYAHVAHHHDDEWSVEIAAVAGHLDDVPRLLALATEVVAAAGGGHVTLWAHGATTAADARASAAGFVPERDLLQLRVPLPLPTPTTWPADVRVRTFRPGEDDDGWLGVNNRAFAGHPEQGDWTHDHLRHREKEDWFDPAGFLVAFDDEGMAGFCWTKIHPADPPREPDALGEIYVIGADPRWHGRGLGRALTSGGLESLAQRGVTVGMLYVDGANAAAVGLYHALGFTEHRVDRAYGRTVAPTMAPTADSGP
ncbi:MAG: mycothiol synthase [Acidimicrobiia bacterium]